MGRLRGGPSRTGAKGAYLDRYVIDEQRSKPAHFQRNPPGRGQLAVFLRCSRGPYGSDMGTSTASPARTALKNGQLTCGDITIICETAH
jgi:hypothetical protein